MTDRLFTKKTSEVNEASEGEAQPEKDKSKKQSTGAKQIALDHEEGVVGISSIYQTTLQDAPQTENQFRIIVEVECTRTSELYDKWQIEMFGMVMQAYQSMRTNYYAQINQRGTHDRSANNPLADRITVQNELKRACARLLFEHMQTNTGSQPTEKNQTPTLAVNKPRFSQFANYALEWNEMTYSLLEEFDEDLDLLNMFTVGTNEDDFYAAFLQSEGARVLVPVRPEFNHRLLYYLRTGMLWIGEDRLVPATNTQKAIVSELKEVFSYKDPETDQVNESWELVVPTSMQVFE